MKLQEKHVDELNRLGALPYDQSMINQVTSSQFYCDLQGCTYVDIMETRGNLSEKGIIFAARCCYLTKGLVKVDMSGLYLSKHCIKNIARLSVRSETLKCIDLSSNLLSNEERMEIIHAVGDTGSDLKVELGDVSDLEALTLSYFGVERDEYGCFPLRTNGFLSFTSSRTTFDKSTHDAAEFAVDASGSHSESSDEF